ncbi:MAG: glycoside hydrolase [Blastocatellia bacterium]|nr:MAG: glycoside hydrolase [Blastocatellia bacterium]
MTQVAILWHMHQPFYEDLVTREHILPWVRLHALKDYYGMVALLREFPEVRVTFNLVPSLLVQLEAFAGNRAKDRFLELSLKPATELTDADIAFVLANFFHAQRHRMIEIYPRYAELLALRGGSIPTPSDSRAIARRFSRDDLRDLQVWHKLAWIDPIFLAHDARARALVAKGRGFTEDDKILLRRLELDILNQVIPEYREAAARGQIEISTSPFYHPILPLLCDTNVYLHTHPDSPMPRHRFQHPEDAADQLNRAAVLHERLFGQRPVGLWPSEGSVSDAIVPLAAAAGYSWMATDELVLARTLGIPLGRDHRGLLEQPEHLYAPYEVNAAGGRIACVFRDHVLSDLIGFAYAGWSAEAAANDFASRLVEAGRQYSTRTGHEALISVILDGENAWEHFEGGGRPFLRALYSRLTSQPELRTVTMAEACTKPRHELTTIFPGSWIDANFYIWIGHADDQRAWSQLAEARQMLSAASGIEGDNLAAAREEVLIAEGSDWFWWYGDDHSSAHDEEFDDLFRRHLRNAYRRMQKPVPDELFVSNITTGMISPVQTLPTGFLMPTIDGEESSYFEWLGAGMMEVRDVVGAMHASERKRNLLTIIHFGFGHDHLVLRLDGLRPIQDLLADGYTFSFTFLRPPGIRFVVSHHGGHVLGTYSRREGNGREWIDAGSGGAIVAAGSVFEGSLPLVSLGLTAGEPVSFFVTVYGPDTQEVERHPQHRVIDLTVPDERFEARNWTA